MDCRDFKNKHKAYTEHPLPKEIWETKDYEEWTNHLLGCPVCEEWHLEETVKKRGHQVSDYPCVHIAYHATGTCEQPSDPWDCPDLLLVRVNDGFALPIRDGGSSFVKIVFCPWCGKRI